MNQSIGRAVAAAYEDIRTQTERDRRNRRADVYGHHPELVRLDEQIASAGAELLLEAIDPDRPKQAAQTKEKLEQMRSSYLAAHDIDADFDRIRPRCSICRDSGRVNGTDCRCYRQVMMPLLIENANLKALRDISFDQYDASLFSPQPDPDKNKSSQSPREHMVAMKAALERYVQDFDANGGNLLFLGRPGTGKTFLMACLANALLSSGHMVLYISAPELFERLAELRVQQASFQPDPVRLEQLTALHDSLLHAQLLLIDDLGTESRGANRYSELLTLVDRRLAPGLSTVISSNADPAALKDNYDERLLSRLMGSYSIYRFFGEDVRLQLSRRRRGGL